MNLLTKYLKRFLMKHSGLRVIVRKIHILIKKHKYEHISKKIEIDDKLIVFETFMGRQYGCNPKALYEQIINDSRFDDFSFVWVLNDASKLADIPQSERVKTVSLRSAEYYKCFAAAKFVITNSNLDYGISHKEGQVFLQTWHGTPLKRLRCDITIETGNALNSLNEIRQTNDIDVTRYDLFISPSKFATEKFISAFNLETLNKENIIIETGYPRNDLLFKYDAEYSNAIKEKLNIPKDKKVILYAPTFRDNMHNGEGYAYDTHIEFERLQQKLSDEYIILFRAHYFVASKFDFKKHEGFVYDVSGLDDITPLYTIADMLITDYSSVFFDYANLRKPMLFYMYDLEEYATGIRGFYIDIDELPGPILRTENALVEAIIKGGDPYSEKYEKFNKKYNSLEDGNASKRVVDKLLLEAENIAENGK